jgi:hypothetical protein
MMNDDTVPTNEFGNGNGMDHGRTGRTRPIFESTGVCTWHDTKATCKNACVA